jgi:hypothetical protein
MAPIDVRTGIAADAPEGAALTRRIQEKNIFPERAVVPRQRHRIRRGLE